MSKSTVIVSIIWLILAGVIYYLMDGMLNPNKVAVLGEDRTVTLQRSRMAITAQRQ